MTLINEANIYRLIFKSQLPGAEKFEEWLFEEVIPSVRKHGAYLTPSTTEDLLLNPDLVIGLSKRVGRKERKPALGITEGR